MVFAASVSWFGLERPVLRLAHRVAPGRRRPPRPASRVTVTRCATRRTILSALDRSDDVASRGLRPRPRSRRRRVYAVAILLVVWPGVLHARTQILGAGDDARYYTWLGWRMGRLIAHGHIVPFHVGT